ncbi:MAG TPA: hypothetical protein VNI77_04585 [Nitrososphaera sp.]|nr:hypothetical protein [Nitrososphaera sp.]
MTGRRASTAAVSDFGRWKASVSYGHRWIAEYVFSSAMKRMLFGEYICVMARRHQNAVKEMFLKASLYNMFMGMKL